MKRHAGLAVITAALLLMTNAAIAQVGHDARIVGEAGWFEASIEVDLPGTGLVDQGHQRVKCVAPPQRQLGANGIKGITQGREAATAPPTCSAAELGLVIDEDGYDRHPTGRYAVCCA